MKLSFETTSKNVTSLFFGKKFPQKQAMYNLETEISFIDQYPNIQSYERPKPIQNLYCRR